VVVFCTGVDSFVEALVVRWSVSGKVIVVRCVGADCKDVLAVASEDQGHRVFNI
jgi:hypothetical protein